MTETKIINSSDEAHSNNVSSEAECEQLEKAYQNALNYLVNEKVLEAHAELEKLTKRLYAFLDKLSVDLCFHFILHSDEKASETSTGYAPVLAESLTFFPGNSTHRKPKDGALIDSFVSNDNITVKLNFCGQYALPIKNAPWRMKDVPVFIYSTDPNMAERPFEMQTKAPVRELLAHLRLPLILKVLIQSPSLKKSESDGYTVWLDRFITRLVNNPHIHRLRWSYCQATSAFDVMERAKCQSTTDGWNTVKQSNFQIWWKMENKRSLCIMDGSVDAKFFDLLGLLYEVDLHKTWLPFIGESVELYNFSTACKLCRHASNLPWPLPNRESLLMGTAIDALNLPNQQCIVVAGTSVPETATAAWGVPIIEGKPITRINMKFFTFCISPYQNDENKLRCRFILDMDPQVPLVPQAIQTFVARHAATRIFKIMRDKSCQRSPEHEAKMKEHLAAYDFFIVRVQEFYKKGKAM